MLGQHYDMHLVMLTFVNPRRAWARGFWYFVRLSIATPDFVANSKIAIILSKIAIIFAS